MFFETSSMPTDEDGANMESAMLDSPEMPSTGPDGKCLKSVNVSCGQTRPDNAFVSFIKWIG